MATSLILTSTYTNNDILAHTPKGMQGPGICSFLLDGSTGEFHHLGTLEVGPNVAFMLKHSKQHIVYATTECIDNNGELLTLRINAGGKLELLDRQDAMGKSTCFINIDSACRYLTIINYWDAKVCTFSLSEEGLVTGLCDVDAMPGAEYVEEKNPDRVEHWKYRQRWPHTHCAVTAPNTSDRMFICDLGRDKVLHYVVDHEKGGKLLQTGDVQLDSKIGPRGIEFHPHLPVAYITNELTSTVSVCRLDLNREKQLNESPTFDDIHNDGSLLFELQRISTLPEDWQDKYFTNEHGIWKAASHSSEIRLHPTGRFLYVGNRGHDSIACFLIDQTTGTLTLSGICPSGGKCPRNFNVDLTGRWMIVGNQDSDNISVFEIDCQRGTLMLKQQVDCPSVNYVYAIPPV
eukprot:GGOE01004820.1.p1 GENE.GGOE01004820.1~~GGOE01004820.1.p1  ORF type:complete len:404 (+),score=99.98 GGOE01004820.1:21-1232(+)